MAELVIVDTGCANINSVYFAIKRLGVEPLLSLDAKVIKAAPRVIVPGVGTAKAAMRNLAERELISTLQQLQQPVLGICLGMQLLNAHSMEGDVACLNLIPGEVAPLNAAGLRLPHMGWNTLNQLKPHPILRGITEQDYFYFVHSFAVLPGAHTLAECDYGSQFAAVIGKDNVVGAQFHPERSSQAGARLLQNFLEWQL